MPGPGCPTLFKQAERNATRRGGPAGRHSLVGHFGGALNWRITSGNCGNCGN
jgi:hypothetical protein